MEGAMNAAPEAPAYDDDTDDTLAGDDAPEDYRPKTLDSDEDGA